MIFHACNSLPPPGTRKANSKARVSLSTVPNYLTLLAKIIQQLKSSPPLDIVPQPHSDVSQDDVPRLRSSLAVCHRVRDAPWKRHPSPVVSSTFVFSEVSYGF